MTKYVLNLSGYNAAWLAGYLDADGCISLSKKQKNGCRTPEIRLNSCDKQLLERVQELIGGHISCTRPEVNRLPQWQIRLLGSNRIISILEHVFPFMRRGVKIARAKILIREWEDCTPRDGKYTPEALDRKLELQERFFAIGSTKSLAAQKRYSGHRGGPMR